MVKSFRSASIFTPGAYSAKTPENDKDPTRSGTNFQEIGTATNNVGGIIGSAFSNLAKLFGLSSILDLLDGTDDDKFDPGAVISRFAEVILAPVKVFRDAIQMALDVAEKVSTLFTLLEGLEDFLKALSSTVSKHDEKIKNLVKAISADPGEVGGNDDCTTTAKVVNVLGTVQAAIYGWWFSPTNPASWLYADSPATDRHGVGAILTSKQPGATRLDLCCNTAKTNGAGLEVNVRGWAKDTVSIGYLTAPNVFVPVRTISMETQSDWAWRVWYNPGDPDDPDDVYHNTYFVFLNGEEVVDLRWTDGGNQVMHGPDYRRVGGCLNADEDTVFSRGPVPTEFAYFDETGPVPATTATA